MTATIRTVENRRMCPNCRAFITTKDRVCPYCGVQLGPRAIDLRAGQLASSLVPQANLTSIIFLIINAALFFVELAVNYRQLQYENQQSIINTDILNNYRTYIAQHEIVSVNDSSVVLARENLSIERERYRLGATTFIELRQAEENLARALTESITARYNLKVAETELLRLHGDIIR